MFVSRSAVANWEQGRRVPDVATLERLMKLLDCHLGNISLNTMSQEETAGDSANAAPADPAETTEERQEGSDGDAVQAAPAAEQRDAGSVSGGPAADGSDISEKQTSVSTSAQAGEKQTGVFGKISRKKMAAIAAAILAAAALLIWLVILPAVQPKAKGSPYISENGEIYTIENMQQPVENISGKAYLMVNPSVQINHGETMDYYIFDFRYHEINGIALTVDRLELIYFTKNKENAFFILTANDIKAQYGMSVDIPAHGDWIYENGLPVQNTAYGVGEVLRCTDENGEKLTFTSYIAFPEA